MDSVFVTIRNKERILFKDKAKAVSAFNDKGVFDILPEHENFISLIYEKVVIHTNMGKDEEFKMTNGILRVYKNNVYIYIGIESY